MNLKTTNGIVALCLLARLLYVPFVVNQRANEMGTVYIFILIGLLISALITIIFDNLLARIPLIIYMLILGWVPFLIGVLFGLIRKKNIHNIAGLIALVIPGIAVPLIGLSKITGGIPAETNNLMLRLTGYFIVEAVLAFSIARYMAYVVHRAR